MDTHWAELRKAIERGIHAVEKSEKGAYRIDVKSAERIAGEIAKHAKGPEQEHAKQVEASVHKSGVQIDWKNGLSHLQTALGIVKNYARDAAPSA